MLPNLFKKTRYQYMLSYIAFFLIHIFLPRYISLHIYIYISSFCILGFALNYYFADKLGIKTLEKTLASLVSPLGFFYILGHDEKLISETELIKKSFVLYKEHFKGLFPYILAFFSFAIVKTIILSAINIYQIQTESIPLKFLAINLIFNIIAFLVSMLLSFGIIRYIARIILKLPVQKIGQELKDALPLFFPALAIYAIFFAITFLFVFLGNNIISLILIGIPIYWSIFIIHSLIIENVGPLEAFKLSRSIVQKKGWEIFWRMSFSLGFFFALLYIILNFFLLPIQTFLLPILLSNSLLGTLLNNSFALVGAMLFSLLTPLLLFISPTILYFEIKKLLKNEK